MEESKQEHLVESWPSQRKRRVSGSYDIEKQQFMEDFLKPESVELDLLEAANQSNIFIPDVVKHNKNLNNTSMFAGHRTEREMLEMSQSCSKDVLADMHRFMKKRANKMARDSEMSQIEAMTSNLRGVEREINETMQRKQ